MMWGPYGYGPGSAWMIGGWIMMLLFWALVIVGIVVLIRYLSNRGGTVQPKEPETPTETLRHRYAAGELTKEQFDEMRRNVA